MFRASMCPSSGETIVFMRHLLLVILYGWLVRSFILPCIPDSHPYRITNTKCRVDTVISPDYGHMVARNMKRLINILRINFSPSWVYLQDHKIYWWSCKIPDIPVILMKFEFLDRNSKNTQISNVIKISQLGTDLFNADRQPDGLDEAKGRFS
jgi:hypothetical protein